MTAVLGVCSATASPATGQNAPQTQPSWAEQCAEEVTELQQMRSIADAGLVVMKKKRGDDILIRPKASTLSPIDAVNKCLFSSSKELAKEGTLSPSIPERLPVWHHLGIEVS